ncbi:MAG: hypothetical protein JXR97_05260 [Planctomycetes bacterium]|nr:hypothetical protein [Planctomycetota bacterium]
MVGTAAQGCFFLGFKSEIRNKGAAMGILLVYLVLPKRENGHVQFSNRIISALPALNIGRRGNLRLAVKMLVRNLVIAWRTVQKRSQWGKYEDKKQV